MLYLFHLGFRKSADMTELGVFSVTVFRGIHSGQPEWCLDWSVSTFFIALAFAALDEWHQSFNTCSRSSRPLCRH